MFTFTEAQMGDMQQGADDRYARGEAAHLARYAPALAAEAGDAGLEAAVHLGLEATRRFGFREGRPIRLCLELMTHLGSHFDSDPQHDWLHPLLTPAQPHDATERARLLYWHSTLYLGRAFGAQGAHGIAAGMRLLRIALPDLAAVGERYHRKAPGFIAALHPQRVPYVSRDAAAALLARAEEQAAASGLGGAAAAPLLLVLMFAFGHRAADDPLHPWVARVLADEGLDPEQRTAALFQRLQSTVKTWLQPVLEARR